MKLAALVVCLVIGAPQAWAKDPGKPLSSIDWLSRSLAAPPVPAAKPQETIASLAPDAATDDTITIEPLEPPSADGIGLLPQSVTGLPADLWGASDVTTLSRMLAEFPVEPLPAVQVELHQLLLAELVPPRGSTGRAPMLQARIDALLARGAVEEAEALLERSGSNAPELFRRAFDVGLLTGREQTACARMRALPGISPSYPVRIFCLARTGDWMAAALTLESAKALGQLTPEEDALLAQFLDADLAELLPPISAPARPTPLTFRMMEAIGEAMPTGSLPLAFAYSDLRPLAGWKARAEAAERLARAGALPPEVLLAIYRESSPAASGGVWDRIAAVQGLSDAIAAKDRDAVARQLEPAWQSMAAVGLQIPFAELFGLPLVQLDLGGSAGALATRIGLLSRSYETVALAPTPQDPELRFLTSLARGMPADIPGDARSAAVAAAFATPMPPRPDDLAQLAMEGRLGEALLTALRGLADGSGADPRNITGDLAFLRSIGLEDTARRAALQLLLLEPPR
ncbi:hypothetical protein [Tropicimonas sp. IMCC34043]|uniref:hypothetical protein n=1 Tax=Tropicimonas sp. IMCC34043 TaxID=2248760 RepID=UPI000E25CAC1|nr:hypothetical protein [Tropicimonas sp. IMCC34043]